LGEWRKAKRQVNGFSGAVHKKFRDRKQAEHFVRENCKSDTESKDSNEATESEGEDLLEKQSPRQGSRPRNQPKIKATKDRCDMGPGMPPLQMTGPDPSIGKNKELFKMSLADNQTMMVKLSPPGLDVRMKKELVDATLDAIQLPGTSNSEAANSTTDLIRALKEIAEDK
jgi:Caulimovirus viroplasmin